MAQLPKRFWRVALVKGESKKLRTYELGAKTYAARQHAVNQYHNLKRKGVASEVWESSPVTWEKIDVDGEKETDI